MAIDPFWTGLAIRMLVSATIVVAASFAVERAGPFVGGLVATLPLSVAPAYAFLAADHDAAFMAETAVASLVSLPATAAFLVAYVAVAPGNQMTIALGTALAAWAATLFLVNLVGWSLVGAFLIGLAANVGATAWLRPWTRRAGVAAGGASAWQVAVRALAVMALVAAVTTIGRLAGPHAAGLASLFPVVFTSLIALMHDRVGGEAMAAVSAHAIVGMIGYGFGFALLSLSAVPLGSVAALLIGLAAIVGWNGLVLV